MPNDVTKLILNHRSIRSYTDEKIPDEILDDILASAQSAPTSNNLQAYTIIVIKEQETRMKVSALCKNQLWLQQCPVFLVFCMDYYRHKLACQLHDVVPEVNEVDNLLLGAVDSALAIQNAAIAAESYGLGCVMIGGVRNNPDKISELLDLPQHVVPLVGLCLGYPNESPWQKPRLPKDAVVHNEVYNHNKDALLEIIKEYDAVMLDYYTRRTEGQKKESWSEKLAEHFQKKTRPHMADFIVGKGFNFQK